MGWKGRRTTSSMDRWPLRSSNTARSTIRSWAHAGAAGPAANRAAMMNRRTRAAIVIGVAPSRARCAAAGPILPYRAGVTPGPASAIRRRSWAGRSSMWAWNIRDWVAASLPSK